MHCATSPAFHAWRFVMAVRLVNSDFDASHRADIPALVEHCKKNLVPGIMADIHTMDASHQSFIATPIAESATKGCVAVGAHGTVVFAHV